MQREPQACTELDNLHTWYHSQEIIHDARAHSGFRFHHPIARFDIKNYNGEEEKGLKQNKQTGEIELKT